MGPLDELYFDVQGSLGTADKVIELVAKVAAGAIVTYFATIELYDELSEYRANRRAGRGASDGAR